MSYAISLTKTSEGVEVTGHSALETIPDGEFYIAGHVNDGSETSAADAISVRGPRNDYAGSNAPTR